MTLTRVASPLSTELERLVKAVIACCLDVHTNMGPGLSENVYAAACCVELELREIPFQREKLIPVSYRGRLLCHQRVDILVDDRLVVEVKSVEVLVPVSQKATSDLSAAGRQTFGDAD